MSALVGLLLVALAVAAGWVPARGQPCDGPAARLARAFAWGAALIGLVQLLLGWLGVRATLAVPLALGVLLPAAAWLAGARRASRAGGAQAGVVRAGRVTRDARVRATAVALPGLVSPRALGIVASACLLVGASATAGLPFRTDGSTFWAPKARELSRVAADETPMLRDPTRLAMHRDYPLLVPALLAPAFGIPPQDAQAGPKLMLYASVAAIALLLADRLGRGGARAQALALAFVTMPCLVRTEVRESIAVAGFVDAPLALFVLMAVDAIQRVRTSRLPARLDVIAAGVFGGALVATKLEGATALAILLAAWALCGPRRAAIAVVAPLALLLAAPSLALVHDVASDGAIVEARWLLDPAMWGARAVPVLAGLLGLLVDASRFGTLGLLLLLCWPRGPGRAFATWVALGFLAVMALAYVGTTMHVGRHVYTSAHRLAFQFLPALVLLAGLSARDAASRAAAGDAASGTETSGA